MKLRACVWMTMLAGLSTAVWAGNIEGKVTGMKGKSVVYVEVRNRHYSSQGVTDSQSYRPYSVSEERMNRSQRNSDCERRTVE